MYRSLEHSIRMVVESGPETEHRVGVTVSDPNHTMVSKRKETILKHVRVKAKNELHAAEKAKAYFKKKGYRVHDTINATVKEDIGNSDKFVGNKQTDKPVPVIKPNNTQDAKSASLARANAKERTSQTMGNNVEEGMADDAKEFALDAAPIVGTKRSFDRAKEAYNKGDYLGAGLHGGLTAVGAAGDIALASGVGSLAGAGIKGLAAKAGGAIAKKFASDAAKKAAVAGAEKAAVGAGEKAAVGTAAKAATAGAAEKAAAAVEKGAGEKAVAGSEKGAAEKGAAEKAATGAEEGAAKKATSAVEKKGAEGVGSNLAKRVGSAVGAATPLKYSHVPGGQHASMVGHRPNVNVHYARKHRMSEETGTDARETIEAMPRSDIKDRKDVQYVGRPDSASSPMDKRSVLIRQEIQKKVIDEETKKKADIIKKARKEKVESSDSTTLGDGKTKTYGDVVVNPKLNPQDYTGNVVP